MTASKTWTIYRGIHGVNGEAKALNGEVMNCFQPLSSDRREATRGHLGPSFMSNSALALTCSVRVALANRLDRVSDHVHDHAEFLRNRLVLLNC